MRGHFETHHVLHLQLDIAVDEVVVEHAAGLQERAILVEVLESLAERAANGRDLLQLLRGKVVEILVHGCARINLVDDAVEASHQHRGEREVGVGGRIGEAHFNARRLRVVGPRNTARSGAIARRIGEQHGGFIAGHQALVGIRRRVRERVERLRMLDDAADVPQAFLRQVGILVAGHDRLAVFPDRLVDVHARTVIAEDGLGHEGRGLAVALGDLMDAVLVDLHVVGHRGQRAELETKFVLRGSHFVMVLLDYGAHGLHRRKHFAAHVLSRVDRGDREIAALGANAVAEVAALIIHIRIARQFDGIELESRVVGLCGEAHVVKHEEFSLGTDEHSVADAGRLQVSLGLLGDAARIAIVGRARGRLQNVAADDHGGRREEGVHASGRGVRHEDHVGFVDRLPASDRRTVEHRAFREDFLVNERNVERDVLPLSARIGEAEVHILDVIILDRLEDVLGGLHVDAFLVC